MDIYIVYKVCIFINLKPQCSVNQIYELSKARVAKCHEYEGYIRVKIFRGWDRKEGGLSEEDDVEAID